MKRCDIAEFGKVAVLYGGLSAEREVSLISGQGVMDSLARQNIPYVGIDVADNVIEQLQQAQCDIVFNILHSGAGENGTIQALLDVMKIPYAGCKMPACALAMDKWRSKLVWKAAGLPVLPAVYLKRQDDFSHVADTLELPFCVKPCSAGSTIGISKVENIEMLPQAIELARAHSDNIIIEPFVVGREFTVGIVQDEVLPVLEICARDGFYDYEAKYHSPDTAFHCPAQLSDKLTQSMQAIAWDAFTGLGGEGWGRVDFMQDQDGQCWILEMNPLPGMTPRSDVPMEAKALGWSYDELVLYILSSAL